MSLKRFARLSRWMTVCCTLFCLGCPGSLPDLGDFIPDLPDGDPMTDPDAASLSVYATNTDGATAIAQRPSDGAIFIVNASGLYGPIEQDDDVSTLDPFGATNLADMELFDMEQPSLVLAIDNTGAFWISSPCCGTMARVPAEGGDAEPFLGLLDPDDPANIFPTTLALVPDGFSGAQMMPGDILAGEDTTFSRLAAIDPVDLMVVSKVENPIEESKNRHAGHLTFGLDGNLYGGRASSSADIAGVQMIATDGTPSDVPGTERVGVDAFVGQADGDLVIYGGFSRAGDLPSEAFNGVFFYDAEDESLVEGLTIDAGDIGTDDGMIITDDGTIYLAHSARDRIVIVSDDR